MKKKFKLAFDMLVREMQIVNNSESKAYLRGVISTGPFFSFD